MLHKRVIGTADKPGLYPRAVEFTNPIDFYSATAKGFLGGFSKIARDVKSVSGFGYMSAAAKHYNKAGIGLKEISARGTTMTLASRTTSTLGVMMHGLMPAFALYGASHSPHGFGIGLAEEVAGLSLWGMGSSLGTQLGGWSGAGAVRGIGKIPGIKKVATTALGKTVGAAAARSAALLGGPIGWFIGGLAAFETAKWAVGLALHTLPTFAKQFKADMAMSGYGGDYTDTAGAATMRQRSLQVMGKSFVNARSALGQEAALLHV
jgi:hypothetical protein